MYIGEFISPFTTGGVDYVPVEEVVTFSVGSLTGETRCFDVAISDDGIPEPPETFSMSLSSTEAVDPDRDLLTVTILDPSMYIQYVLVWTIYHTLLGLGHLPDVCICSSTIMEFLIFKVL